MQNIHDFNYKDCKEQYQRLFSDEKIKGECFDILASAFFDKNFGSSSKTDIELLMFHLLLKQIIAKNQSNGILDYEKCSDYNISKILGITETKVRNLKIKRNLKYPENYNWIASFSKILTDNRYTEVNGKRIQINIPDPNVYLEIKNFIELKGGFVETHLNPKILDMRIEYLYDFALKLEKDQKQDEIKEKALKIINKNKASHRITKVFSIGKMLVKGSLDTVEFAEDVRGLFTVGNTIIDFVRSHIEEE